MVFTPPPALRPGAHVRCIAPAGPFDGDLFARGVVRLGARYRVSHRDDIFARHRGFLAGDDARRLAELEEALRDPSVDAIVAGRGGYGVTRLLDRLDVELVRRSRKLLVGFSDLTALHAAWARAGLRSVHGPMVAFLGDADEATFGRWIDAVEGGPMGPYPGQTVVPGVAEGPLLGGNLSLLAALQGTRFMPDLDGAVLFLEDLNEAPFRVDRLLTTLRLGGSLRGVVAIAVGQLDDGRAEAPREALREVVVDRLGDLGVPVAFGLPAGHIADNRPLALGARVRLEAGASAAVTFLEAAVARPGATGVP